MRSLFPLSLIALISLSLCSCSIIRHLKQKPKTVEKPVTEEVAKGPKLVGRIASISPDKKFVLIQSYGKWEQEAGAILTTRGPDERTANLLATGEKLGEFAAADIQAGTLEAGDAVYSRHIPKPETAPTAPAAPGAAETPQNPPIENVQKNN